MSYFKKLYEIGEEKVNNLRQKQSNPLKEFEEALSSLKNEMEELMKQTAEMHAVKIRSEQDLSDYKNRITEYQRKAEDIMLKMSEKGNPKSAEKAAAHALYLKKLYTQKYQEQEEQLSDIDSKISFLKENIEIMRERIDRYEDEYRFLSARYNQEPEIEAEDGYFSKSEMEKRFEKAKEQIEAQEFEASHIDKITDDLYLADKYLHDADIQDELEAIKNKIKK